MPKSATIVTFSYLVRTRLTRLTLHFWGRIVTKRKEKETYPQASPSCQVCREPSRSWRSRRSLSCQGRAGGTCRARPWCNPPPRCRLGQSRTCCHDHHCQFLLSLCKGHHFCKKQTLSQMTDLISKICLFWERLKSWKDSQRLSKRVANNSPIPCGWI